jgi:hypothetical protein
MARTPAHAQHVVKDVGAAPGVIQHQLGHSDPRLAFELYVLSVPGERRKAVGRVSKHLKALLDPNSTHRPLTAPQVGPHDVLFSAVDNWSGREDLNLRPPGPEPGALPG